MERDIAAAIVCRINKGTREVAEMVISAAIEAVDADDGIRLDDAQSAAIALATRSRFCIITGSAGTGKSTIAKGIMTATKIILIIVLLSLVFHLLLFGYMKRRIAAAKR